MDPFSAIGAIGASSNLALRLVQGGYQYANIPEDVEQLLLGLDNFDETIKTTKTLRRIKSHLMNEREKVNVDRAIETSDSVLLSIRQTVESCRKDIVTKDKVTTKNRLLWLLKDHDAFMARGWTVGTCMQNLTSHITRMSLLQQPTAAPPQYSSAKKGMLRPPARRVVKQVSSKSLSAQRSDNVDNRSDLSSEWNESSSTLTQNDGCEKDMDETSPDLKDATKDDATPRLIPVHDLNGDENLPEVVPSLLETQNTERTDFRNQWHTQHKQHPQYLRQPPQTSTLDSFDRIQRGERRSQRTKPQHNPWAQVHNTKFVELPGSEVQRNPSQSTPSFAATLAATTSPIPHNSDQYYPFSPPSSTVPFTNSTTPLSPVSPLSSPPPYYQTVSPSLLLASSLPTTKPATRSPSSSISSVAGQGPSNYPNMPNIASPHASWNTPPSAPRTSNDSFGSSSMTTVNSQSESGLIPLSPRPKRRIKSMFIT